MEKLAIRSRQMIRQTTTRFTRFLDEKIAWQARLIAILGARGVGKTTLMLQHIRDNDDIDTTLYVDAGDFYFTTHSLLELAETFYQSGGKKLYIDEIHRYHGWSDQIKNIYDYLPGMQVVYSGSSILELERGGADLSRRKLQYYLPGLSFREYIHLAHNIVMPVATLDDVLQHHIEFSPDIRPVALFKEYLRQGYYPFFTEPMYYQRLVSTIESTLEVDIPQFASMTPTTIQKLKKLFYILAQSVPFKPNNTLIAKEVETSRASLTDALVYMEKAGLIRQLWPNAQGMKILGKADKLYLNNTNLAYAISESNPEIGNIRETAFDMCTRVTLNPRASEIADFNIDDYTFEVGGHNKGQRQIRNTPNAFVVKDDIEYGAGNIVPLWSFGFLY